MSHWFDRMSRAAAGEANVSRRDLFVSAGVAAFGTTVLASDSFAATAMHIEGRASQTACEKCLLDEIKDHKKTLKNCDKSGNFFGAIPGGPRKGKKARAAPPVPAAKKLACIMRAESSHAFFMKDCGQFKCRAPGMKIPPATLPDGTPTGSTGTQCAPGTSLCSLSAQLCCYGDDACCPCKATGGFICCASAVGCGCC